MTTPRAAAALEVGQHHVAEDAAAQVAARIDHDDVARLRVVEDVAVQLHLRVGVLVDLVMVLALRHELQGQRGADRHLARRPVGDPAQVRIADAEAAQLAGGGGAADLAQALDDLVRRANDILGHDLGSCSRSSGPPSLVPAMPLITAARPTIRRSCRVTRIHRIEPGHWSGPPPMPRREYITPARRSDR